MASLEAQLSPAFTGTLISPGTPTTTVHVASGTATSTADDSLEKVRASYGPSLDRLVRVKTKYDPKNLFHLNANIQPLQCQQFAGTQA